MIFGLGEFRPKFEGFFVKEERTAEVVFCMSVLTALKQLNRIGLAVSGIVCLGRRDLEAESYEDAVLGHQEMIGSDATKKAFEDYLRCKGC